MLYSSMLMQTDRQAGSNKCGLAGEFNLHVFSPHLIPSADFDLTDTPDIPGSSTPYPKPAEGGAAFITFIILLRQAMRLFR